MRHQDVHPLRRLFRHCRHHRGQLSLAIACSVLNKLFDLAPPLLIGVAIDVVVKEEDSWLAEFGIRDLMDQLVALAVVTVIIWGLESVFEYAYKVLWRNLAQRIQHELRMDSYRHVQELGLRYFENQSTGRLMSILNDDINQLERFLDDGANEVLQVSTTVVAVGAMYFGISVPIAIMAFVPVPLILWGSFLFQRRIAPRYADVRERVSRLNETLANNIGGIATIKSFTAEDFETERMMSLSDDYQESNRHAIRLSSAFSPLIRMVIVVGFAATLVYGGRLVADGSLAVGLYSVLIFLTQRLLWPLTRLGSTFDQYQRAMASTDRVLDLLHTQVDIRRGNKALPDMIEGQVEFENVSFRYSEDTPLVLENIDLAFPPGKTTAIVGATGAGKSTLLKLLLRFYDVDAGVVRVEGRDVRELDLRSLRQSIAFVSQDVFLFHGTVRDNIAYARPDAQLVEVQAAARAAEAHGFIERLPKGYDSVVGERGQKLSGGQRQRISLARAILKSAPIFVLDEATSAVDNETEAAIQRSLDRISAERTTIVIAHRLSTIRHADNIVVLDAGRIVEQGRHEDLLERGGIYAALWTVQTGERPSAAAHQAPAPLPG